MTGSNRRPYACKAYALPAELIVHKYVDITSRLAFLYPQRLDAHLSWSALPLLLPTAPRPCCSQRSTYIFTLHQSTFQPSVVVRPIVRQWFQKLYLILIGVIYNNPTLTGASSIATGREPPYAFGAQCPTRTPGRA